MIYVLSQDSDVSTDKVLRYLHIKNVPFFRFDLTYAIINRRLNVWVDKKGFCIKLYDYIITKENLSQSVFWYRRQSSIKKCLKERLTDGNLFDLVYSEFVELNNLFYLLLNDAKWLGKKRQVNKIEMIYLAHKVGLNIPATVVTGDKVILRDFCRKKENVICKSIGNKFDFKYRNENYLVSPHLVFDIERLPKSFAHSMVQTYIDKYMDIRIFYLCGMLFPFAIFSQEFDDTKIDFRINPKLRNGLRISLICIPLDVQSKLIDFMNLASLDTGSIDMVYKDGEYIFLEVNPQGQFGGYAAACGCDLYKVIADKLIEKYHENE